MRPALGYALAMQSPFLFYLAKGLEGLGLVVVLVGVLLSMKLGMGEQGLESMKAETYGLAIGMALFVCGWLLERSQGTR